jgi:hypothetical protein
MVNRISVIVSDEAKNNLVDYQRDHSLRTRDDALNEILLNYPKLDERIKELENQAKK